MVPGFDRKFYIGQYTVSTVGEMESPECLQERHSEWGRWLPLGFAYKGRGGMRPMWYETLISADGGIIAGPYRYETARAARAGHATMIRLVRRTRRYRKNKK